jgi:uncharacterized repeat protein (TIGR03803 family)
MRRDPIDWEFARCPATVSRQARLLRRPNKQFPFAIPKEQGIIYASGESPVAKSQRCDPMKSSLLSQTAYTSVALAAFSFFSVAASAGVKEAVLVNFSGGNGASPNTNLTLDSAGNLYGTTYEGGPQREGSVFELTKQNGVWIEIVLYNFCSLTNCADGAQPGSSLTLDSAGNLYGTTEDGGIQNHCVGGAGGCGLVFELSPNSDGGWTETVLYSFTGGEDGEYSEGGLVFDSAGNLYGAAAYAGHDGAVPGVVFELSPTSGGTWNETVLYTFTSGAGGDIPVGNLVFDKLGNLYGTTESGGSESGFCSEYGGCGVVFELTPTQSGPWQETVLHAFTGGADGAFPGSGQITFNKSGSLLGTASAGGNASCPKLGCGVAYELTPGSNGWTENALYSFNGGADGESPVGNLTPGPNGDLYGVTNLGGANGKEGVVFELVPNHSGGWTQQSLSLGGKLGRAPYAGLTFGTPGEVYGTTSEGGSGGGGTVFELQ